MMKSRTTGAAILLGVTGLILGGACRDSSGPYGTPIPVAVGDTITGQLGAGDSVRVYSFEVQKDSFFAVFLQSLSGDVGLEVGYSGFYEPLGVVRALPGKPLDQRATEDVAANTSGEMEIRISKAASVPPEARFRFLIRYVNRATESIPPDFQVGDTVQGEKLETIADFDHFTFTGQAGRLLVALVQALDPVGSGTMRLEVHGLGASLLSSTTSNGGDSTLDDQVSPKFELPLTGQYDVWIRSVRNGYANVNDYAGPYRFQLVALDSAPELRPAQVQFGDTVPGEIRPLGDIDVYSLSGPAGSEFNVFFQATSGLWSDLLDLEIPGIIDWSLQSSGTDTNLIERSSGTLTMPTAGTYPIRVHGAYDGRGGDRGPYRFFLYPIDHRPEVAPQALVLGDSVEESIELPGDVDEYQLAVPESTLANFVIESLAPAGTDPLVLSSRCTISTLTATGCGRFWLAPGAYVLSVSGTTSSGAGYYGGYRLKTYAIRDTPEFTPDTIAIGDTIDGESIVPLGDLDRYVFYAQRGQHVNAYLQGLAPSSPSGFGLEVHSQQTGFTLGTVLASNLDPNLTSRQTNRIDIPTTGWYNLTVGGDGFQVGSEGPYRIALVSMSSTTESVAAEIKVGDSVVGESLDFPGDFDEFTVTAVPGDTLAVEFLPADQTGDVTLAVYDSAADSNLVITGVGGTTFARSTRSFTAPPSGRMKIRVYQGRGCNEYGYCWGDTYSLVGPYWFKVFPVNRAPELISATVLIGDTVSGEDISPPGDIDEFTFSGSGGQALNVYFHIPVETNDSVDLFLEVVDPVSGAVLGSLKSYGAMCLECQLPAAITLPTTGTYLIRVRSGLETRGTGEYGFEIKPVP